MPIYLKIGANKRFFYLLVVYWGLGPQTPSSIVGCGNYWGLGPQTPLLCVDLWLVVGLLHLRWAFIYRVFIYRLLLGVNYPQTPRMLVVLVPYAGPARGRCPPAPPTGGR